MRFLKRFLRRIKKVFLSKEKYAKSLGVKMGNNIRIKDRVSFGSEPYLVELGNDITISNHVEFITHDGGTWAFRDLPEYQDVIKYGKIKIGNNTFIGSHSIIMPGVTIGERCVVGVGSIVTKDVPDGHVVCGIPARVIKTTKEYAEHCKISMKPYNKEEYKKDKRRYLEKYL